MDKARIIGKVLLQSDRTMADSILKQFRPMLSHIRYVEQIYNAVQETFQDETFENRRLIFIGTVYQVYQPLSFLATTKQDNQKTKQAAGKLPAGIRDEIARCLGFASPEMASHFKTQIESPMKPFNSGPERPFKTKVMSIVERFKCFSINPDDYQFKMAF